VTHALWLQIFAYAVYVIAVVLLWMTYRRDGFFFAAMPVVFFLYFLISELLATQGGLPYRYGELLPHHICVDLAILAQLAGYFFGSSAGNTCPEVPACVPLCVPMMEAMLVFGALRTSMVFRAPGWLQPFMVALVCAVLDWILDPTSAVSEWCGTGPPPPVLAKGIEFWRWFIWGHYQPAWSGIPLINFGAWYFGTVGITLAAGTVTWVRAFFPPSLLKDLIAIILTLIGVLLLGLHLEKLAFVWMGNLFLSYGESAQWAFIVGWAVVTAGAVWSRAATFDRSMTFYWEWLPIPALLILSSLVGLLIAGPHALAAQLIAAWVVILVVEVAYALWPYRP
jgi:hypothetical protein